MAGFGKKVFFRGYAVFSVQNQFQAKGPEDANRVLMFTDYCIVCWDDSHYINGDQSTH